MYRVIILSTCPDWAPYQTDTVHAVACTYADGEDYFMKTQTLFDIVGLPIGHPFDVVCWEYKIPLSDDERSRFDFLLKSGKEVSGRNKRRDLGKWVLRCAREVKNGIVVQ